MLCVLKLVSKLNTIVSTYLVSLKTTGTGPHFKLLPTGLGNLISVTSGVYFFLVRKNILYTLWVS